VVVALFMILSELGIDIGPLLAGAGVIGIAVGFGAQSLIKDLLGGMFILIEDQYNKGDVVKIAGIAGLVEEVNLRRTVLRDLEGIVHSIPNGQITTVSNYTRDWARVKLDISVGYGEDMDHVFKVINRVGKELAEDKYFKDLIKTPPQVLRVQKFGDSGIDIRVLGDVRPMKQWEVTGELRKRLKKAFDDEGIEIPWPHVKLYFGESQQGNTITCQACSQPNLAGSKFCANCGGKL
jgi:small conductance mechanosensitive channel